MQPLALNAQPGAWRIFTARKADPAFLAFQAKIFERDRYTCQFCGFQASEYQEVINLDQDYYNNKAGNLLTACCFCAQCFFLESIGLGDFGGGTLIYLPEMDQNNVSNMCHVLFCAIANESGYKESAQSLYRSFKFRSQVIEEKFGEGMSDPAVFGRILVDSGTVTAEIKQELLKDIRLLPSRAKFSKQIASWTKAAESETAGEQPLSTVE